MDISKKALPHRVRREARKMARKERIERQPPRSPPSANTLHTPTLII